MKLYKFVILIILSKVSFCQNFYSFSGVLILENDQIINYSLNLIEKNGKISGFSLTNIGLEDETKTEINGIYFKYENEFQLNEKNNIYTNSSKEAEKFCYISMNLKVRDFKQKSLEGTFIGNFDDGKECARGKVLLMEDKKIKKTLKKIKTNSTNNKINTKKIITTKKLRNYDTIKINWKNDSITINIWDTNQQDGDKVNLILNNKIILNDFYTKKDKKQIHLKLKKGMNILNLTAINEGKSPPNTSSIELIDEEIIYPFKLMLNENKTITIELLQNLH